MKRKNSFFPLLLAFDCCKLCPIAPFMKFLEQIWDLHRLSRNLFWPGFPFSLSAFVYFSNNLTCISHIPKVYFSDLKMYDIIYFHLYFKSEFCIAQSFLFWPGFQHQVVSIWRTVSEILQILDSTLFKALKPIFPHFNELLGLNKVWYCS